MLFTLNSIGSKTGKATLCNLSFFNVEGIDNSWIFTKYLPNSIVETAKDGLVEVPFWCCKNFFTDYYVCEAITKQARKDCHTRALKSQAADDARAALLKAKEVAEQTDIKIEATGEFLGEVGQNIICDVKIKNIINLGTFTDESRWIQVSNGIHTYTCHWEHPSWTKICVIFEDQYNHLISSYVTAEKKQSLLYDAMYNNKTLTLQGIITVQKVYQNVRQVQIDKSFKVTVLE